VNNTNKCACQKMSKCSCSLVHCGVAPSRRLSPHRGYLGGDYARFRATRIDHGKGDGSRDLSGTCECSPARTFRDGGSGALVLIAHGIVNATCII
jgi:hypothetical protein